MLTAVTIMACYLAGAAMGMTVCAFVDYFRECRTGSQAAAELREAAEALRAAERAVEHSSAILKACSEGGGR